MDKLNEVLEMHRMFHDDVQIHCFILGGRHPWDRYKQALRELYKRVRGIRLTMTERDKLLVDIDELKAAQSENEFDGRRKEIQLREMYGRLEEIERSLKDTYREARHFYAEVMTQHDKYKNLTEEKRRKLDLEAWSHRWLGEAAASYIVTGRLQLNLVNNIMKMPVEYRSKLLEAVKDQNKLISWFETEYGDMQLNAIETELDVNLLEDK